MSAFVTRPATPVPLRVAMSMPCSPAMFRTTGDERRRSRSSLDSPGCGGADGETNEEGGV
jgi:hypothetical protein